MDINDNPLECGFDKYVNLDADIIFLGKQSLIKIKKDGIKKKLMGVKVDMKSIFLTESLPITSNDKQIGELRSGAFSLDLKVVGIAMVNKEFCNIKQTFKFKLIIISF